MDPQKAYEALKEAIENSPIVVPCQNTDPELWFGDIYEGYDYTRMAKKLCFKCPARKACAEYAIASNELYGVWGATSRLDRIKMKRQTAA
jgi:WhiB family redox-sensing transcriptional regulator